MVFFIFIQILIDHSAFSASNMDLHCLPMSQKKDALGLNGLMYM